MTAGTLLERSVQGQLTLWGPRRQQHPAGRGLWAQGVRGGAPAAQASPCGARDLGVRAHGARNTCRPLCCSAGAWSPPPLKPSPHSRLSS